MLSEKQKQVLGAKLPRITILDGAISSGKTFIGNNKAVNHLVNNYQGDGIVFFIGKTIDTLERNVLEPLERQLGRTYFTYRKGAKKAELCGIPIELEGCNDIRAESKIRGTTAEFIYGDELTLWNKSFLTRCMGSLRTPKAKFFGTTNPDTPNNFVYTDFIQRKDELDMLYAHFMMTDNPALTEEYKRQVNIEYTGVFHDRFIKGLWVKAEGLVYPMFDKGCISEDAPRKYTKYYISVDYGTQNATSMGLWGLCDGVWYRIKEYYHSGRETGRQKTDEEYCDELEKLAGNLKITSVIIDPTAASFIAAIKKRGRFAIRKANNAVIDGIRNTATALEKGLIKISENCPDCIREFGLYAWDEKSSEDKPIKDNDHSPDEVRYFANTILYHNYNKIRSI